MFKNNYVKRISESFNVQFRAEAGQFRQNVVVCF
jgi:hypothetical protein